MTITICAYRCWLSLSALLQSKQPLCYYYSFGLALGVGTVAVSHTSINHVMSM